MLKDNIKLKIIVSLYKKKLRVMLHYKLITNYIYIQRERERERERERDFIN